MIDNQSNSGLDTNSYTQIFISHILYSKQYRAIMSYKFDFFA